MKSKILFSLAVVACLFVQQLAAQDVSRVLQNKEERQMLYYSILNNDERFYEFMESIKLSGRANDGLRALNDGKAGAGYENELTENQLFVDQMLSLMEEILAKDPDLQRVIERKYPEVGEMMRREARVQHDKGK